MPSKEESMQKQHLHAQKEHAEWLDKLHRWRAEHQRVLAKLSKLQAALLDHNAEIDEQLGQIHRHEQHISRHERVIAAQKGNGESTLDQDALDGHSEGDKTHRELRAQIKRMEGTHDETVEVLNETIDKLKEIRSKMQNERDEEYENIDDDEVVHEASVESFPASDSPSFNPGRT
jgi:hypothetical protein